MYQCSKMLSTSYAYWSSIKTSGNSGSGIGPKSTLT